MENKLNPLGFKSLRKVLEVAEHQTGTSNKKRDEERKAEPSGKRASSKGNIYYEYRKNRSDMKGKRI